MLDLQQIQNVPPPTSPNGVAAVPPKVIPDDPKNTKVYEIK